MPQPPDQKARPHPLRLDLSRAPSVPSRLTSVQYVELATTSNYTFLTGASHPDELVCAAANLGHASAAIADVNTLGGIVRAHVAAREIGMPVALGARLRFADPDGLEILCYPTGLASYSNLSRILTIGKRRAPKGECHLHLHDLVERSAGLQAIVVPPEVLDDAFIETLNGLRSVFNDDRLSLAACVSYAHDDRSRLWQLKTLSKHLRVPLVAINDAHAHEPSRRPLQDAMVCVRLGTTIHRAGFALQANAERHLKPPEEMARLFAECPGAIARTVEIARRAHGFSIEQLKYRYPREVTPQGVSAMRHLRDLTRSGAAKRYGDAVPEKVRAQIEHEFALIEELDYPAYFLTVHDIVRFARERGILCQGRGAAANSAVCYCLGVTEVDPAKGQLLFERFISRERNEPPDIDIDFEHERREEVIQHLYGKYGRDRAALTAETITYRGRSAVRDMGKAMGLSLDVVDRLAQHLDIWASGAPDERRLRSAGVDPRDPIIRRVVALTEQVSGFPRHRSQHVGGFVLSDPPLCDIVPIENAAMDDRTVIEWDKDDVDAAGMLKVDVLGLGMLTCIRRALSLVVQTEQPDTSGDGEAERALLSRIARTDDAEVYEMAQHADTIGVFQIESRAQMSMLPRLRPKNFYDLTIQVAIVRPGPIQGNMVHPYLRRRNGEEPVEYPSRDARAVLERTLGVPLFQEQAMALAITCAGFTPDEAERLRRSISAWKTKGNLIHAFGMQLIDGMTSRGIPREFAERCFEQIKGFSQYGFPESHAASFALLVYISAWLKRHHPAAFAAALINSQPMGFYAPSQIVRDAIEHGVEVRDADVNLSDWDCALEGREVGGCHPPPGGDYHARKATFGVGGPAIRLGLRLVKGLSEEGARKLLDARSEFGRFDSVERLHRASGIRVRDLRRLAAADALRSMGLDRQQALWQIRALRDDDLPLFDAIEQRDAAPTSAIHAIDLRESLSRLPAVSETRKTMDDYQATGLSLRAHPLQFIRPRLDELGAERAIVLRSEHDAPHGKRVTIAGLALCRQRPATASGVVFITLEDETGIANLILRPKVFERFRPVARLSAILLASGRVERKGEVVHVQVDRLESLDGHIAGLAAPSRDFH
ncbi:MAG: error-prone DNA polymerase [Phycisphaerales bacterium]